MPIETIRASPTEQVIENISVIIFFLLHIIKTGNLNKAHKVKTLSTVLTRPKLGDQNQIKVTSYPHSATVTALYLRSQRKSHHCHNTAIVDTKNPLMSSVVHLVNVHSPTIAKRREQCLPFYDKLP